MNSPSFLLFLCKRPVIFLFSWVINNTNALQVDDSAAAEQKVRKLHGVMSKSKTQPFSAHHRQGSRTLEGRTGTSTMQ
jgi:hypothetical protein